MLITCRTHFSQPINHSWNGNCSSPRQQWHLICHGWWKNHCVSFVRLKRRFWHSRSQNPSLPHSVSSWNTCHSPGWCTSYLLNRPQHVCIGNAISKPVILDYSVPQGSVLGPQWFTVCTSPVRDIILKYNLNYHVYADDTQLYITLKSSKEPADSCITTLEKCIQEIRSWMRQNFLKLNDEFCFFLLFGSR